MTQTRGFAITKEDAAHLRAHGLPDKAIYQAGRGAESLEECLASFRGRVGKLIIARDLRVLGESKRAVADAMAKLEKGRIRVVDISHPGDTTIAEMVQRASVAISGCRFRDRRRARILGRAGGLGNGVAAKVTREGLAPGWLIDRIIDHPEICWRVRLELLSPHFSESSLRRHYGAKATARK